MGASSIAAAGDRALILAQAPSPRRVTGRIDPDMGSLGAMRAETEPGSTSANPRQTASAIVPCDFLETGVGSPFENGGSLIMMSSACAKARPLTWYARAGE